MSARLPETYGEMRLRLWRSGAHEELTRAERAEMSEADAWSLAHPREVLALEAMIGHVLVLRKLRFTFAEGTEHAGACPAAHRSGTLFRAHLRLRDRLLVRAMGDVYPYAYLIRPEWVFVRAPRRLQP